MKSWLMILLSTFAFGTAWAAPDSALLKTVLEKQTGCENFVRYDDQNIYLGFGVYYDDDNGPRKPIPGRVHVAPLSGASGYDLATKDGAVDVVTDEGHAFILTYSSLEEWDLASRARVGEYKTYDWAGPFQFKQNPEAMARFRDTLVIAHGRLGVSFFDLKAKKLSGQLRLLTDQFPLESMATGVTVAGGEAYLTLDDYSEVGEDQKPPFRGIVVVDPYSQTVMGQYGGMDPGADAIVSDSSSLVVSFSGNPLWRFSLDGLSDASSPNLRIWRFPVDGHPTGKPAMDSEYYYTCFMKAPPPNGDGYYRPVPLALDRKALGLD